MNHLSAASLDNSQDQPVLVVDKSGKLGSLLLPRLTHSHLTVFVSTHTPPPLPQCVHIPFHRKVPVIPENNYSQTYLIYQGEKELLTALPSFIRQARGHNGKIIVVTTVFHLGEGVIKRLHTTHPEVQLLILGDLFGECTLDESQVQVFLDEAKLMGKVTLPESGLMPLYPVHSDDVIEAMLVLGMGTPSAGSFALFPKHPPTALSFVRLLQRVYPLLTLDFSTQKVHSPLVHLPEETTYIFGPSYPLESRLRKLDLTHTPLASTKHKKRKKLRSHTLSQKQRQATLAASLLFFILALPLLLSMGLSLASGALLLSTKNAFAEGQLRNAQQSSGMAVKTFSAADYSMGLVKEMARVVTLDGEVEKLQTTIQTGTFVAEAVHEGLTAALLIQEVAQGNSDDPENDFYEGLNKGREALRMIQRLDAEDRLPDQYRNELDKWEPTLDMVANTMGTYPELLGFSGKKSYLILFQNNYELRPTGGFIGSYGILTLEQGRVVDFTIHDVYDADGKLTQKIVPPFGLSRYLGAANWFLRDSNYYLDYPTSAATAANFLKMETGQIVDGVIAIDVYFLASLLEATGPLHLPDYNETLTEDNFFLVTQTHAEKDFFPGSTQKKDFLRAVRTTFEGKLKVGENIAYPTLLSVVTSAITQKHLLFAFSDPHIQKIFSVNHMSGAMLDTREETQGTLYDYLTVNEANIGLNKGNYYLKREINHKVAIDGEGRVKEEAEIVYTNTSTPKSPFGGDYKSYVRIVLPEDASLLDLRIDGRSQEIIPAVTDRARYTQDDFIPPRGIEVEEVIEDERKVLGLLVAVPVQSTKKVSIVYNRTQRAAVEQATFSYDLLVVKQPGTDKDPYRLELVYPVAVRVTDASTEISDLGGKLTFETPLIKDQHFSITFAKQ